MSQWEDGSTHATFQGIPSLTLSFINFVNGRRVSVQSKHLSVFEWNNLSTQTFLTRQSYWNQRTLAVYFPDSITDAYHCRGNLPLPNSHVPLAPQIANVPGPVNPAREYITPIMDRARRRKFSLGNLLPRQFVTNRFVGELRDLNQRAWDGETSTSAAHVQC